MNILRRSKAFGIDTSRSGLIIGLLVLILCLVLALAWQASRTMRTHRATATGVLQDYARLVADEYTRKIMAEVGYYGYYAYVSVLRRRAFEESVFPFQADLPDKDSSAARAARLAHYLFFIDLSSMDFQTSLDRDYDADVEDHLTRRASELMQLPAPESGFSIDHAKINGSPHTFVISTMNETGRAFGFEVDRAELSSWLWQTFEENVLLPKSLAGGAITNEYIYLRFVDADDRLLFESRPDYDASLLVSSTIDDAYEGIFRNHKISAAVDPAVAGSLLIGGLPRSRLPALIAVILLTVGLLIAAIRQLLREQAVMKIRSDFVSEVSHELRTPLTQIRMFTETLLLERFSSADDKRRALEIINRESQRLIHLVENVLRFSKRTDDRRELYIADSVLAPLIQSIADEFRPLADAAGVKLQLELDSAASAPVDHDTLRQILLNLLDNAVKYGPPDQCVQIRLTDEPATVRIGVADEGPGIPVAERERIWEGYYRLERARHSAIAGTGIGLAVVRELVTGHGGKTWVRESCRGGARFMIEFPKSARHEGNAPGNAVPPAMLNSDSS